MSCLVRVWLAVALMASATSSAAGEPGFTNALWNPSFEMGRGTPDGWKGFGFCERDWSFRGRGDSRCISITAGGKEPGWWYASRLPEIGRNELYRLSFWARSGTESPARVLVGTSLSDARFEVGPEWQRYELIFRTPRYLPDPKVRFGEDDLNGTVFFDDVALEPVVAIHRSEGVGGSFSLGEGERIVEGQYAAVHDIDGADTNDCRFLDSYTGEFHDGKWVLDGSDEVVYRHSIDRLGVALLQETLVVADEVKYAAGSSGGGSSGHPTEWVSNDPRAERGLLQMPVEAEIEVAQLGGKLAVQVCQDGSTWLNAGVIERTGRTVVELPSVIGRAYDVWVRLKSWGDRPTHVTGYRFRSLVERDNRTTADGASHYVAVLFASSDVNVGIDDVGEIGPDGRNEVKLMLANGLQRVHLGCRVMVEKDGEDRACSDEHTERMAPRSQRRIQLPYEIGEWGEHRLRIVGRDVESGRLLFLLGVRGGEAGVEEEGVSAVQGDGAGPPVERESAPTEEESGVVAESGDVADDGVGP